MKCIDLCWSVLNKNLFKKKHWTWFFFKTWIDLSMKGSPSTISSSFFLVYPVHKFKVSPWHYSVPISLFTQNIYASFTFKFRKCRWFFFSYSYRDKKKMKRVYLAKGAFQNKWRLNSRVYCVCHVHSLLVTVVAVSFVRFVSPAVVFFSLSLFSLSAFFFFSSLQIWWQPTKEIPDLDDSSTHMKGAEKKHGEFQR